MRGFLQPSLRKIQNDDQKAFSALSRGRRSKLAKAAKTTLVKADQWARGDDVARDVSGALEQAFKAHAAKAKPKKKEGAPKEAKPQAPKKEKEAAAEASE
jgi:hypothetical protein